MIKSINGKKVCLKVQFFKTRHHKWLEPELKTDSMVVWFCGMYHFGSRMKNLHLFQDGGSIICNGHVTFLILDLKWNIQKRVWLRKSWGVYWSPVYVKVCLLTILSIPLGPRLVLMASATAVNGKMSHYRENTLKERNWYYPISIPCVHMP